MKARGPRPPQTETIEAFLRKNASWTRTLRSFQRKNRLAIELLSYLGLALIGYVDYATGYEISLTLFYLIPIFIVTWSSSLGRGIVFSTMASLIWLAAEYEAKIPVAQPMIIYWNAAGIFVFFLIFTVLLAALKTSLDHEEQLARSDSLTGLANRRAFFERTAVELDRSRRTGSPLSLVYIDVDNFKVVNDTLGHPSGDFLLKTLAAVLSSSVRKTDIAARLGGDEFVVLFPGTTGSQARIAIQKIRTSLGDVVDHIAVPVTFSMGGVTFYSPPSSIDSMLSAADRLMYEVKKTGKNGVKVKSVGKREPASPQR